MTGYDRAVLTLLEPGALWLLLSLPVIVLLFFIRERRRQQEVSALFLWTEAALSARRRRRISPALLLLLQLLLAALLAFALAQPRVRLEGVPPRVFVVDASASMAASTATVPPGGSRLEAAVTEAEALLSGAGEVALVRAGLGAAVVQPPTGEHALVRRALRELSAADASADLGAALELARSLAPGAELHLFSDSAPPAGSADVNVHAAPEAGLNYGVSAFDLAYGQLFASVVGNADTPQTVELVFSEDREVGAGVEAEGGAEVRTSLLVPAGGQANTSLPLAGATGRYRARLEVSAGDALALDNEAVAGVRALTVRLLGDAPALGRLLAVLPGVTLGGGEADVTVAVPAAVGEAVPAGDAVLFAPPEANPEYAEIAASKRDDPLLRFADLAGVTVAPSSAPLPRPLAQAEVLARTAALEPVLLRWREGGHTGGRTLVYFAFHPGQSDLPRRPAFPIVVANAVEAFRGEVRVPLGTLLPGGERLAAPGRTERAGRVYTAAPLPAAESRLAVTALTRGAARQLSQNAGRPEIRSEAFRDPALWLVGGALALLLGEWLLWSRVGAGIRSRGRGLRGRTRRSAPR